MKTSVIGLAALLALNFAPLYANAQGVGRGAEQGAAEGARDAGPIGGVVGGVVGGVTGGVEGLLGVDQAPRFHDYVRREHVRSYHYGERVHVGVVLPSEGIEYYPAPPEYGTRYYYTVVDGETVLVEPRSHRIVQVIE